MVLTRLSRSAARSAPSGWLTTRAAPQPWLSALRADMPTRSS